MMDGISPKDWSPRWKDKPWIAHGYEEWEFEEPFTWLVHEAARMGLWSRGHSLERSGGGSWYRFDSKKLWKVLPKVGRAKNFPIEKEILDSLRDLKGAILIEESNDLAKVNLYWNKYEFQADWGELMEKNPDPYR